MVDLFDFDVGSGEADDGPGGGGEVLSVTQLTRKIRNLLELRVGEVWVEGEVSNLRKQASGHQYFTLKDAGAQISCVLFRGDARNLAAPIENGQSVQLHGEVSVYEPRGNYQIIVRLAQAKGLGALQAKFEALKRRLDAEGLFDESLKRPLPPFPLALCLVTSPTGAALQDMLNILGRRAPWVRVFVYPVRVQGKGAAGEISAALRQLARGGGGLPEVDTVVVARGGGSLEDLWPFNEEEVARAIAALEIPTVSAVGHEIDFTIADFAADLRAPTPSAAAELVVPDGAELRHRLDAMATSLRNRVEDAVGRWGERLDFLSRSALLREPRRILADLEQEIDWKGESLAAAAGGALAERRDQLTELRHRIALRHPRRELDAAAQDFRLLGNRLSSTAASSLQRLSERCSTAAAALKNLGPDAVLARGYSVTLNAKGEPISDPSQVSSGDSIRTQLASGEISSTVD